LGTFLQVNVPVEDTDSLRFLWWPDGDLNKSPEQYKMMRHIFGATDSPSCCNYVVKRTAQDNQNQFSQAAVAAVKREMYVDDFLKSVDMSPQEAMQLVQEVVELLGKGGFRITKLYSNNREILSAIPQDERANLH
jgi:hypothetical protein